MTSRRLAWVLCGATLVLLVPITVLTVLNRNVPDIWAILEIQGTVGILIGSIVGFVLATRRPGNAIGWLLLATALLGQVADLAALWGVYGLEVRPGMAGAALALWLNLALGAIAGVSIMSFLLLLFPDGRFPDRRARIVGVLSALALVVFVVSLLGAEGVDLPPHFPDLYTRTPNPLAEYVPFSDPGAGILALGLCALLAVALLLLRFRVARGLERRQYKLVVLAMVCVVVIFVLDFIAIAADTPLWVVTSPANSLSSSLVPIAMGIAILRYQLFDIDRVINRTLVYAALSVGLVGTYALVVIVFQAILDPLTQGSDLAVAATTLLVAALFRPLRFGIQQLVDRRFNRAHYDAERTVEAFSSRLRDEVDLEAVGHGLVDVVNTTMQPAHVSLWMRPKRAP